MEEHRYLTPALRRRLMILPLAAAFLAACGSESKPAVTEIPAKAPASKPADETHRLPKANRTGTGVADNHLMNKPFMPGGSFAKYRKGKTEYEIFLAKLPSATGAAILLLDWKKSLSGAKLIPSFGGYFGQDADRPVFVFTKGLWITGIAGLPEKEADLEARTLAGLLD